MRHRGGLISRVLLAFQSSVCPGLVSLPHSAVPTAMGLPLPWPWGLRGRGNSSANRQLLQSSLLLIRELTCEKSAKCPLAHSLLGKESLHSTAWLSTQAISGIFRQQKISAFWISLQRDSLVIKVQTGKAVAGFTGLYEQLVDWSNQHFSYLRYFQDMGIFSNCVLGSCIFFFFLIWFTWGISDPDCNAPFFIFSWVHLGSALPDPNLVPQNLCC